MMSQKSPAYYLTIGFVIGGMAGAAVWFATQPAPTPSQRNVIVDYMYETDAGSASGNRGMKADLVQFYPGYVVIRGVDGTSQLMAVDRLRKFQFRPNDGQ